MVPARSDSPSDSSPSGPSPAFSTTCWSEVRKAARLDPQTSDSLQRLCAQYWYPLYCYLRRDGLTVEQAEDGVQSFFADILSRDSLKSADPNRGKFRTFLLTACKNHVSNLRRADGAKRRGGDFNRVGFETREGEKRYSAEPVDNWTPDKLFLRHWALTVIDAATARVRLEYEAKDRGDRFAALMPLIAPASMPPTHAEIGEKLGCSAGAVKVAAHRLRQQFAQAMREEIASTIDTTDLGDAAIDEELSTLLAALRNQAS